MDNETGEIVTYGKKIEHTILVNDMKAMLNSIEEPQAEFDCYIYKVPPKIRERNDAAYTPRIVSIGPIHHGDHRFEPMEELKLRYMKFFLQKTDKMLEDIIDVLKKDETHIRSCYERNACLYMSDDFVRIILVDACFIIEFFLRNHEFKSWFRYDPIISKPWLNNEMKLDLILIENQLPFFVLEDIFGYTCGNSINASFLELSFRYLDIKNENLIFKDFCRHHLPKRQSNGGSEPVKHFTDLVRRLYLPCLELQPKREWGLVKHLYSASQLREAGVKFEVSKSESITELQFDKDKGVLIIPRLELFDSTEILLRNIVALEQCCYPYDAYMTDYIQLLNFLINNKKDVDFLMDRGIVGNFLRDSDEVAYMIKDLGRGVTVSNTNAAYQELCKDLNALSHNYKVIFKRDYFNIKRDYFSTPWRIICSIAAIALLLFTFMQAICSLLQLVV